MKSWWFAVYFCVMAMQSAHAIINKLYLRLPVILIYSPLNLRFGPRGPIDESHKITVARALRLLWLSCFKARPYDSRNLSTAIFES